MVGIVWSCRRKLGAMEDRVASRGGISFFFLSELSHEKMDGGMKL
jgi:hypothetical protein